MEFHCYIEVPVSSTPSCGTAVNWKMLGVCRLLCKCSISNDFTGGSTRLVSYLYNFPLSESSFFWVFVEKNNPVSSTLKLILWWVFLFPTVNFATPNHGVCRENFTFCDHYFRFTAKFAALPTHPSPLRNSVELLH